MRRYLKLEICTIEGWPLMLVRVLEQTHRKNEFTSGDDRFTATNGYTLISLCHPAARMPEGLYVRGDERARDSTAAALPREDEDDLRSAVAEYNRLDHEPVEASKPAAEVSVIE